RGPIKCSATTRLTKGERERGEEGEGEGEGEAGGKVQLHQTLICLRRPAPAMARSSLHRSQTKTGEETFLAGIGPFALYADSADSPAPQRPGRCTDRAWRALS